MTAEEPAALAAIQDATEVFQRMQRMLAAMGADARRESSAYQVLLGRYKALGQALRQARFASINCQTDQEAVPPADLPEPPLPDSLDSPASPELPASPIPQATEDVLSFSDLTTTGARADEGHAATSEARARVAPIFTSTLGPAGRVGATSHGMEVRRFQEMLAAQGYDVAPTGAFDIRTARSLQAFQRAHGLAADGLVGAKTRRVLNHLASQGG